MTNRPNGLPASPADFNVKIFVIPLLYRPSGGLHFLAMVCGMTNLHQGAFYFFVFLCKSPRLLDLIADYLGVML